MSTGTESTSSPTLADQLYDNTMAGSSATKAGFGLHYAIAGISDLADALQGLEGAAAAMANDLGRTMMEYSDAENADTQAQTQVLEDLPAADDDSKDSANVNAQRTKDINDQQALISSHQTIYGNEIQTVDAMSQQWQTTTSSVAQGIASLYSIIGEIIQVISNVANKM
jgi:hypothetical protein